jgi:hypothetical protein
MKKIVFLLCVFVFVSCSNNNNSSDEITQEKLAQRKQEIMNYINSFECTGSCNYIAFGSKPCGGPREYLVFSSAVDFFVLDDLVTEYNELDNLFNIQTGAVSDCMVVSPPTNVDCINGDCVVVE